MRGVLLGVMLGACAGPVSPKDGPDTGDTRDSGYPELCPAPAMPVLEFDVDLQDHSMRDGAQVPYGTPPQGGAPYTPFQVRAQADLDVSQRVEVTVRVTETSTGTVLGEVVQPQAFFCSNTGVHEGWRYGGEVHARYTGWALEDLSGRAVTVHVEVATPAGPAAAEATGVLRWALGPGAPDPLPAP